MASKGPKPTTPSVEWLESKAIPEPNSGCLLWLGAVNKGGYGRLTVAAKSLNAHRLAWELNYGPIQRGLHVCHKCDNTYCINPAHLFLGTARDNAADRDRKGRGSRKLSDERILAIYRDTGSLAACGRRFGTDRGTVSRIRRGLVFARLTGHHESASANQSNPEGRGTQ